MLGEKTKPIKYLGAGVTDPALSKRRRDEDDSSEKGLPALVENNLKI